MTDQYFPPKLQPHEGSWAIVDKFTGRCVTELFRDSVAINFLNTCRYEAIPIGKYLASLSTVTLAEKRDELRNEIANSGEC